MFFRTLLHLLRNCDIYGQEVRLLYKGKEKMKTIPGAIMSLLSFAVLLWYFILLLVEIRDNQYTLK